MIYNIILYQIDSENVDNISTRLYAGWKKNESRFNFNDYTLSYNLYISGDYNVESLLDEAFRIFNGGSSNSIPEDFPKNMHYISTSDVIQYNNRYYFRDIKGFVDVTNKI